MTRLPRRTLDDLAPVRDDQSAQARRLLEQLGEGGSDRLRSLAGRGADEVLLHERAELERALLQVGGDERALLTRTARRVELFAREQLGAWHAHDVQVTGGRAGQRLVPVASAGCLARPDRIGDVIQGVTTAKVAGVPRVLVACETATPLMLAAAAAARADGLLALGGALGAAALGLGLADDQGPLDVLAGPADGLTRAVLSALPVRGRALGASPVLVLADRSAEAGALASDLVLLAEAGHGPLTVASSSADLLDELDLALERLLADAPEGPALSAALAQGAAVELATLDQAEDLCRRLAPGLLLTRGPDADHLAADLQPVAHVELGSWLAVPGPGAWLPAGTSAAWLGPLSVTTFLREQTWTRLEPGPGLDELLADARGLAHLEGRDLSARLLDRLPGSGQGPAPRLQPQPEARRAPPAVATQLEG